MTLQELLNDKEEEIIAETKSKRERLAGKYSGKNSEEILPGRKRLISAICKKSGASRAAVKSYVNKMFAKWFNREPEAAWIARLERKARNMESKPFNPRDYRKSLTSPMPRGASAGKSIPEYNGRAYFFVGLMNGMANHFKGKDSNKTK